MKILVLCHCNAFRSPVAMAVLRQRGFEVQGAGFSDLAAKHIPAAKKVRDVAATYNLDLSQHRSQQVTKEMIDWADKIIIMDGGNKSRFYTRYHYKPERSKLLELGSVAGLKRIPDPAFMRRDSDQLKQTVKLIIDCSNKLADQLLTETTA